ncbi:sugar phosphate nucleotidyltransferase [Polynucleobacter sp. MWH-UH25E]|uniref:sugar phosphate nucleotidyltransferase n=1 Tax=Polynucleobacter sp. MWH-UH25E TaxID=1855616 RepID=UPI001BFD4D21|nr:sugar phosphate nucleotidyltransferase [Polynucleobacter sp. MWH-UH25E]
MAGGFGTRLQSVLDGSPKALAPVNNKPFLSLQIEHWLSQGVDSFVFLLHHRADLIIEFLKSEESKLLKDCNVQYVVESKPMGTGGAIAYAIEQLAYEGDFLLTNADTWLGIGVDEMMKASSPSILVVKVEDVGRYGEVVFDNYRLVTAFVEKRENPNVGWINAGISRLNADLFKGWDGQPFSLEKSTYPQLVEKKVLAAITLDADFIDIGIPEDYLRFCCWIESEKMIKL